jgi:hypothetical protein
VFGVTPLPETGKGFVRCGESGSILEIAVKTCAGTSDAREES